MKSVAVATVLAFVGSVSAFIGTPLATGNAVSRSALQMSVFDKYGGGMDFRNKKFEFDPLNLSKTYEPFQAFFRESEIRHGRTAMLAVVGFITTDYVRLPGDLYSFAAIPKTIDAHDALAKSGPMYQLLLWISLWDIIIGIPAILAMNEGEREPGDFGLKWFAPKDDAKYEERKAQELLNGRLAMVAIGGIATQSVISGHGFPYV